MTIDNVELSTQNSISPEYPLNLLQAVGCFRDRATYSTERYV